MKCVDLSNPIIASRASCGVESGNYPSPIACRLSIHP